MGERLPTKTRLRLRTLPITFVQGGFSQCDEALRLKESNSTPQSPDGDLQRHGAFFRVAP